MFFNITTKELDNFPIKYRHGNLVINLDSGWHQTQDRYNNKLFYKGYVDHGQIDNCIAEIAEQEEPMHSGNFCLLKCFDKGISIKADRYRSFPIWYDPALGINNLTPYEQVCWTDSFVTITNSLEKIESKFDAIGTIETSYLSFNEVVDQVDQLLADKILKFAKINQQPLKVFLSGGIDTMTLYSYILKLEIPHEQVNYYHTDLDYFYLKNHGNLSNFWGYRQFHYWSTPAILLSGAPGDEFNVRSPETANMMLRYHDTSIGELLPAYEECYMYQYFSKYEQLWEHQKNLEFESLEHVIKKCLDMVLNDWQHWHLGETISYTPFRDIDIFKTIARLNKENLIMHVMDASVQKELIRRNAPELLDAISKQKNSYNFMENLTRMLF